MTNTEYLCLLSLPKLFRARDAVKTLINLGFNEEYQLALEKDIEIELSKRQDTPAQKTEVNVFNRLFRPLGELLKEL